MEVPIKTKSLTSAFMLYQRVWINLVQILKVLNQGIIQGFRQYRTLLPIFIRLNL